MLLARSSLFVLRELSREENPTGESGEEEEFSCLGSCQLMSVRGGNAAAVVMGSCRLGTCDCFCFSFLFFVFCFVAFKTNLITISPPPQIKKKQQ